MKIFYICWVEGSRLPPTRKFKSIKEAKECVSYLMNEKGVSNVHIMKVHSLCKKSVNYQEVKAK